MEERERRSAGRRQRDVLVRDKKARNDGENGDLDGILLQLENIPVGRVVNSVGREEEMIGAEGSVPVGVVGPELSDDTRQRARGGVGGEGDEEEVGFVGVLREKGAAAEGIVEERSGGVGKFKRFRRGVDEDFQSCQHILVVLEKGGWGEVGGR